MNHVYTIHVSHTWEVLEGCPRIHSLVASAAWSMNEAAANGVCDIQMGKKNMAKNAHKLGYGTLKNMVQLVVSEGYVPRANSMFVNQSLNFSNQSYS